MGKSVFGDSANIPTDGGESYLGDWLGGAGARNGALGEKAAKGAKSSGGDSAVDGEPKWDNDWSPD